MSYRFQAELWVYPGENPWYFVTLPFDHADEIEELTRTTSTQRGFGSVRVRVTVGSTTWATSVFPDNKAKSYVLPMKKQLPTAVSKSRYPGAGLLGLDTRYDEGVFVGYRWYDEKQLNPAYPFGYGLYCTEVLL